MSAKNADGATLTTSVVNYQVTEGGRHGPGRQRPGHAGPEPRHADRVHRRSSRASTQDYTSTLTAQILSTAGDAKLTVADASDTNVGKMVNGTYALPQTVQVGAQKVVVPRRPDTLDPTLRLQAARRHERPDGRCSPTTARSAARPSITFKQSIAATDALRTGSYSKTLTFTLSTTNP